MKGLLKIVVLCQLIASVFTLKQKRSLVWPTGPSKVQAVMGLGLPVDLEDYAAIVGIAVKAAYQLPSNSSLITKPNVIYARKKRALSRWDIYSFLAQTSNLYGFGEKACVLRTICELANIPIDKNYGLVDEIVHAIFTPTTTKEELDYYSDNEYYAAHKMGKKTISSCKKYFDNCAVSFVDWFSKLVNY